MKRVILLALVGNLPSISSSFHLGGSQRQGSVLLTAMSAAADNRFWPQQHSPPSANQGDANQEKEEGLSRVLDSVVQVHCTHSEPDYLIPWQRQHQSTSTSSGFVIDMNDNPNNPHLCIVTNAHSVEYGTLVQVQRRGDGRKYEATVVAFANECDVAILHIASSKFWQGLTPLKISATLPSLQDEVEVLGYPTGGTSLSITSGVVSRIEMQEYSQSCAHLLAIQIDAAINAGNSGGPVVSENREVIGVAFQGLDNAENIGYVVPVTVLQHVLSQIKGHGRYLGFASLGIVSSFLESKALRKSLGMMVEDDTSDDGISSQNLNNDDDEEEERTGVLVKSVAPTAAANGILLPKDVICKIDDTFQIGNDGKIPFRPGERVAASCYTQTKFLGDTVKLQVWRDEAELELVVPVSVQKTLLPAHWNNRPPPYLIVAGLVFTVLSVPYLHASEAWESYVSDNMSYLLGKWHEPLERETDQVVILAQVLAHRENLGYDQYSDLHLLKVNGKEVRSLRHLKELMDTSHDEPFLRLEFGGPHKNLVVLEREKVDSVTEDVCREHFIPHAFHLHPDEKPANANEKQAPAAYGYPFGWVGTLPPEAEEAKEPEKSPNIFERVVEAIGEAGDTEADVNGSRDDGVESS